MTPRQSPPHRQAVEAAEDTNRSFCRSARGPTRNRVRCGALTTTKPAPSAADTSRTNGPVRPRPEQKSRALAWPHHRPAIVFELHGDHMAAGISIPALHHLRRGGIGRHFRAIGSRPRIRDRASVHYLSRNAFAIWSTTGRRPAPTSRRCAPRFHNFPKASTHHCRATRLKPASDSVMDSLTRQTNPSSVGSPRGDASDVDKAVSAARKAFDTYSLTSVEERIALSDRIIYACERWRDELR